MKKFLNVTDIFMALFILCARLELAWAEAPMSNRFGPNMAITNFLKDEGFQMSTKALTSLKIRFVKIEGARSWSVPEGALVKIKQSSGVYRRVDGWITFVLAKVERRSSGMITITSEDLQEGDEVAISGVNFLRMTEADLNSDTVDNCAH